MKLHLDKLEVDLDSQLVAAGGDLLMANSKAHLTEVEKNLWVLKIENQEVEVQTVGRKIKTYSCECLTFINSKICKHTIAALLGIRAKKDDKKKSAAKKKPQKAAPKRLTVSTILNSVDEKELVRFIGIYARMDQQFTNALKTRFATHVDAIELKEKYDQLLRTLIRSYQSSNQTFTRSGAKKIHDMLDLLLEQVTDEFRGGNYVEVFEACKNIIGKVSPIIERLKSHRNDILSTLERSFVLILKMLNEPISPKLRLSITRFFLIVLRQRYFDFPKIEKLFFSGMMKLISEAESRRILTECLDSETDSLIQQRDLEAKIFFFYAAVLDASKGKKAKLEFEKRIQKNIWLLPNTVDIARKWRYPAIVKWLSDLAFQHEKYSTYFGRFDEIRYQIAKEEEDAQGITYFAAKRILSTLNPSYLEDFLSSFKKGTVEVNGLISRVAAMPYSDDQQLILANLFLHENDFSGFANLIKESDDLELVREMAPMIYEINPKEGRELIWQKIDSFLSSHIGKPPVFKVRNFIRELYQEDASKLAKWLLSKIRSNYKSRKPLIEELAIFR